MPGQFSATSHAPEAARHTDVDGRYCAGQLSAVPSHRSSTSHAAPLLMLHSVPEGRFASLLIRDNELALNLAEGFETLWRKAMRSLQEINFDPRRPREPSSGE